MENVSITKIAVPIPPALHALTASIWSLKIIPQVVSASNAQLSKIAYRVKVLFLHNAYFVIMVSMLKQMVLAVNVLKDATNAPAYFSVSLLLMDITLLSIKI